MVYSLQCTADRCRYSLPKTVPELFQGNKVEGQDISDVEDDPVLDEVEVLCVGEEAGVLQQLGDLAGVHPVAERGKLLRRMIWSSSHNVRPYVVCMYLVQW